jgi:hypothetical protein
VSSLAPVVEAESGAEPEVEAEAEATED